MLKKFLGIFKRDKSGFSDEELKRQVTIGQWIRNILMVILVLIAVVTDQFVVVKNIEFFKRVKFFNDYVDVIIIGMVIIVIVIIEVAIYAAIFDIIVRALKLEEINAQLQKNSKEKQTRKLLSCIEEQDFSKLGIEWAMIDEIFRLCLKSGIIEIKPFGNEVEVSLSELIKDVDPVVIEKDKLLTYFDFETEEDDEKD